MRPPSRPGCNGTAQHLHLRGKGTEGDRWLESWAVGLGGTEVGQSWVKLGDYLRFHLARVSVPQPYAVSHIHSFLQRELRRDRVLTWPISCLAGVPGVPGNTSPHE